MTIEMIDGRSTIHECKCEDATPCEDDCTYNHKGLSPVIDADAERLKALMVASRLVLDEIEAIDREAKNKLRPLYNRLAELQNERERLGPKASCFGKFGEMLQAGTTGPCDSCPQVVGCCKAERGISE